MGLVLPLLLLYFNKGYRTANRYLAGFLFFCSLYLLENFYFFYGSSLSLVAFFTNTHTFFYLIGPFAFFYQRSILKDDSKIYKADLLHFGLFLVSFIGFIPYFFSSWDHKLMVARNIQSDGWDMDQFHINILIPHKIDQAINLLQTLFYAGALWYMMWKYQRKKNNTIGIAPQYILIRKWLLLFTVIFTVITINFIIAMANVWIFDDKTIFLQRANGALLFAACVYVAMNLALLFFPQILYGLPSDLHFLAIRRSAEERQLLSGPALEAEGPVLPLKEVSLNKAKPRPQLFGTRYVDEIEKALEDIVKERKYLSPDFQLNTITRDHGIPAHHLTYYFNEVLRISFSVWRNRHRIEHAILLINQGLGASVTLEAIASNSGFLSQNTFIRSFKLVTGYTPSEFLKNTG